MFSGEIFLLCRDFFRFLSVFFTFSGDLDSRRGFLCFESSNVRLRSSFLSKVSR